MLLHNEGVQEGEGLSMGRRPLEWGYWMVLTLDNVLWDCEINWVRNTVTICEL